eukprot:tig00021238_g19556.t1
MADASFGADALDADDQIYSAPPVLRKPRPRSAKGRQRELDPVGSISSNNGRIGGALPMPLVVPRLDSPLSESLSGLEDDRPTVRNSSSLASLGSPCDPDGDDAAAAPDCGRSESPSAARERRHRLLYRGCDVPPSARSAPLRGLSASPVPPSSPTPGGRRPLSRAAQPGEGPSPSPPPAVGRSAELPPRPSTASGSRPGAGRLRLLRSVEVAKKMEEMTFEDYEAMKEMGEINFGGE